MGYYYLDTNALVKLVLPEKGHDGINRLFSIVDNHFIISSLSILEINSALSQKVNRNEIKISDLKNALTLFNKQILTQARTGKISVVQIDDNAYTDAAELVLKHRSLRTLDALHLVTALNYKDLGIIFVTADKKLKKAAKKEELEILTMDSCKCPHCGKELTQQNNYKKCSKCGHVDISIEMKCLNCGFVCAECNIYVCKKYNDIKAIG